MVAWHKNGVVTLRRSRKGSKGFERLSSSGLPQVLLSPRPRRQYHVFMFHFLVIQQPGYECQMVQRKPPRRFFLKSPPNSLPSLALPESVVFWSGVGSCILYQSGCPSAEKAGGCCLPDSFSYTGSNFPTATPSCDCVWPRFPPDSSSHFSL